MNNLTTLRINDSGISLTGPIIMTMANEMNTKLDQVPSLKTSMG